MGLFSDGLHHEESTRTGSTSDPSGSVGSMDVVLCFRAQYPNAWAAYFFYALSELRFLNISVTCYSQSCFFRFFESDNFRFQLSDTGYNFPLFVFVPWAPIFGEFILIHIISCLGLEGIKTGLTKNRTGSLFLPPSLTPFSHPYVSIF